jgi:dihydroorotase
MNPPLRANADREAVRAALADGTLDAIATDHAPHAPADKETVFAEAANGIVGLETALTLGLGLVREGLLSRRRLVELLTTGPAKVIPAFHALGTLAVGAAADIALVDPEARWTVEAAGLRSKSKNSPWLGKELQGRVIVTLVGGKVVHRAG